MDAFRITYAAQPADMRMLVPVARRAADSVDAEDVRESS
jgi:hypothetical protein